MNSSRRSDRDRDRDREYDRDRSYRDRGSDRDRERDRRDHRDRRDGSRNRNGGRTGEREPRRGGRPSDIKDRRSRSPRRDDNREDRSRNSYRDRSPPKGPRGGGDYRKAAAKEGGPVKATSVEPVNKMEQHPDDDEETAMMRELMGFVQFNTTKEKKVPGNAKNYGIRHDKKMEARQYMNRQGGFNRPLSPSR